MTIKTHRYFENTGGLNLRFNEMIIEKNEAEEIMNLHATSSGSWTTDNIGYLDLNATPLAGGQPVTSLYHFRTLAGISHLMAVAGSQLFSVETSDGAATEITGDLTAGKAMQFVTFQGLLIGCNGSDPPKKWDGSGSPDNLAGWPAVIPGVTPGNPSVSAIFANRLVFAGDPDNPSLLYISALEDPENFTPDTGAASAGAIQVTPGDGQKITALRTLYLPLESAEILVIFKERSTYILAGHDADTFILQKVSDEFGAVSHRSVVRVGNELMFLSREGVTSLTTATVQGNITASFMSSRIQPQVNNLNAGKLSDSFAVHLRNRQEVWWAVPDGGSTRNQRILVLNYGQGNVWSRRSGIIARCGEVFDGNLYTGNYAGVVSRQLKGSSYNGQPIDWKYRTPFYDLGSPRTRKRIRDVEVYLKQISEIDVTVKTAWDVRRGSKSQESRTLTVVPDISSSVYGEAVFGEDEYGLSGLSILRFIPDGSGKFFQLEFSGSAADKPVEIQGWTISAIYGGQR